MVQFGVFSVTMEILQSEELNVEHVINKVRSAAKIDDEVLDGDSASKSAFTVEAFRKALAEEQKFAASITCAPDPLKIKRVPGADLTVEEAVRLVRAPEGDL